MKPEIEIERNLKEATRLIESAQKYLATDQVGYSADEIDLACEKLMQAYAIAREFSDL